MGIRSTRREIQKAYKRLRNWRKVGTEFHITGGMAYRIAKDGYEPKDPHIRVILGLPALVPAPVCRKCGEVHTLDEDICPKETPIRIVRAQAKPNQYKDLFSIPTAVLAMMLANREEF